MASITGGLVVRPLNLHYPEMLFCCLDGNGLLCLGVVGVAKDGGTILLASPA